MSTREFVDRFRQVSGAGRPWWESHPPRYAGPELAADYLTRYGVRVGVRE
ncbi:MAG TPA: hypothetical protein VF657_19765 [Actinoplanes sp.]|jgi:hypothetical protein